MPSTYTFALPWRVSAVSGTIYTTSTQPVAPVAYQVVLEPGIGQFREFESPRVHTRINSHSFFLCTH